MKKKMFALLLCAAMTATLLAGCSTKEKEDNGTQGTPATGNETAQNTPAATGDSGKYLFFCPKCVGYDYWTSCEKGITDAAAALGYKAVFNGPATTDSAKQISMIEDMLTQGISGLGIAPNDAEAISATIEEAQKDNVNVITFDTDSPNSSRSWYVGPDSDYAMGQQLAEMIAKEIDGKGEIAFMVASLSAENQVSKVEGATDYLAENYPDISIVTTLNSNDDNENAFANAQTLLTTYPDLKGIVGFAGAEAPQAAEAITQAISNGDLQEGQIAVTGIGFPTQCRPYIKSGVLKQVLSWNPQVTGKVAVYVLAAMEEGKTIDGSFTIEDVELKIDGTNIYHGCLILDIDNIDEYTYS